MIVRSVAQWPVKRLNGHPSSLPRRSVDRPHPDGEHAADIALDISARNAGRSDAPNQYRRHPFLFIHIGIYDNNQLFSRFITQSRKAAEDHPNLGRSSWIEAFPGRRTNGEIYHENVTSYLDSAGMPTVACKIAWQINFFGKGAPMKPYSRPSRCVFALPGTDAERRCAPTRRGQPWRSIR